MAQWVVAAILADLIGFQRAEAARLARSWDHWQPRELAGKRVVIVGYGSIGRAVERRLAPFGVRVGARGAAGAAGRRAGRAARATRSRAPTPSSSSRRSPTTRAGSSAPRCSAACRTARCSSTPVAARWSTPTRSSTRVRAGRIRAALDVTDPEPLPADHLLWTLDGVFITPHNSGDTPEAELAAQALARAQMLRYRAGLPLEHVVRPGAPGP